MHAAGNRHFFDVWVGDLKERFCPVVFSKKFLSKINGRIFQKWTGQKRSFLLLFLLGKFSVRAADELDDLGPESSSG